MSLNCHPFLQGLADADVHWFGVSNRLIGGKPDSRYGWLETPEGPCIVKALDGGLAPYADTLLQHERAALRRLHNLGAPAAQMLEAPQADWLVTRFGGLTLQHLARLGAQVFPWQERLAAWVHLLRRLRRMADAGVLMIDLHESNVVLPLTQGVRGQVRLTEASTIDHAHTVEAGMDLRRPVWLDAGMRRVAPELRQALRADEQRFRAACQAADVEPPGCKRVPGARDAANRDFWGCYSAPQRLQWLLDSSRLSADRAMQFAAGVALSHWIHDIPDRKVREALILTVARMSQPAAAERFDSLSEAAEALNRAAQTALPLVGQHRHEPSLPDALRAAPTHSAGSARADGVSAAPAAEVAEGLQQGGTTLMGAEDGLHAFEPRQGRLSKGALVALSLGTVAGVWAALHIY
jgi:hypothetical protein